MKNILVVVLLCAVIMCASASFAANLLDNGSFEDPVLDTGTWSHGPVAAWSGNFYRANGSLWGLSPQDGNQFVFLNNNASFNWTTHIIQPSTTYTLTYSIGRTSDNDPYYYQVEMFGQTYRNDMSVVGYAPMTLDNATLVLNGGQWKQNTMTFTTGASGGPIGKYLTVWIVSTPSNNYVAFDGMQLNADPIVPEPGSLLALGSGLLGLAGFVIRRKK